MTAMEELRKMLDERGVEWHGKEATYWCGADALESMFADDALDISLYAVTPAQAIGVTLGSGPLTAEVVEKIVDRNCEWYEGGEIDAQAIADELNAVLGRGTYTYEQWREVSEAVGDAMEYAHDRAIEHPDKADPLWNLDEYVNRVLEAAFGAGDTCEMRNDGVADDGIYSTIVGIANNASELEKENAELRELVACMWANQEALPYGLHIEIRDRMRELGIEVQ